MSARIGWNASSIAWVLSVVLSVAPIAGQEGEPESPDEAQSATAEAERAGPEIGTETQEPEGVEGLPFTQAGRADEMMEQIDDILATEVEAMAGEAYSYVPGDRRDPFRSLLEARLAPELKGPRPEGIPGLLIDEVEISGIFVTPEGASAQVQAAQKEKSYLIRVGDQLYDGSVVAMNPNEVVFRQEVRDPTALKPFREVVKKLNPQL